MDWQCHRGAAESAWRHRTHRSSWTPASDRCLSAARGDVWLYDGLTLGEPGPRHLYDALCPLRSGKIGTGSPSACKNAAVRRSGRPTTLVEQPCQDSTKAAAAPWIA